MTPRASTSPADARESNAGDDFHVLWAARRALALLDASSKLTGISVEGPDPDEAVDLDPDGDRLLGVDLAEYFGGSEFDGANQVILSQLKYSTRRPAARWSTARLCAGRKHRFAGSVVHRLAQIVRAYLDRHTREAVLTKLIVRLVSNQPADQQLLTALSEVQDALDGGKPRQLGWLRTRISATSYDLLTSMRHATESTLSSSQFCDFVRILDLSHCGSESRLSHTHSLLRELAEVGLDETQRFYAELKSCVHQLMMPENRSAGVFTAANLAPIFGLGSIDQLYPAPSRLEAATYQIPRAEEQALRDVVLGAAGRPICLHGAAGLGKTTLVTTLQQHLPAGSVTVVFDCFGAGSYLDPSQERHSHGRAIPQLANELAAQAGSALLIDPRQPNADLLRALMKRLKFASQVARASDPAAVVVVVIDAADNSMLAAQHMGQPAFITDLLRCEVPDGCRLMVTCRTHRRELLNLGEDAVEYEVAPFSLDESTAHLKRKYADASVQHANTFHQRSLGVPRVQAYALDQDVDTVQQALEVLHSDGTTMDALLARLVASAFERLGPDHRASDVLPVLLALPRPAPLDVVGGVAGVTPTVLTDLSHDLLFGFETTGGVVTFRDEDFENFLRAHYKPSTEVRDRVANHLWSTRSSSEYAAVAVADALASVARGRDLIALVHEEEQPQIVTDPVLRNDVFVRRARLALNAALEDNDLAEVLRLMLIVADAAKVNQAVTTLLLDNLDLACRYGDVTTIERLYLQEPRPDVVWYGPTYLQCAGHYSRHCATHERARHHLRLAEVWLRHWSQCPEEERHQWPVDVEDVAFGAEAILRVSGRDRAIAWLDTWQPPSFRFAVARTLITNVINVDGEAARHYVEGASPRADTALLLIETLECAGHTVPHDLVAHTLATWCRFARRGGTPQPSLRRAGTIMCEVAIRLGLSGARIAIAAQLFAPPPIHYRLSLYGQGERDELDVFLRSRAVALCIEGRSLSADDDALYPAELQEKSTESGDGKAPRPRQAESRRELQELYNSLTPAINVRMSLLAGDTDADDELANLVDGFTSRPSYPSWREQQLIRLRAGILADAALRSRQFGALGQLCERLGPEASIDLRLQVAECAVRHSDTAAHGLSLADRVSQALEEQPLPGSEQLECYTRCCRLAGFVDPSLAKHYFECAVRSASEFDQESMALLRALADVASRAAGDPIAFGDDDLAADFASVVEGCHWRLEGLDHFPWSECLQSITAMHPGVGVIMLQRWDRRGVVRLGDHIMTVARAARDRQSISTAGLVALSLVSTCESQAISTIVQAIPSLVPDQREAVLTHLADFALRLTPISERAYVLRSACDGLAGLGLAESQAAESMRHGLQMYEATAPPKDNGRHVAPRAEATTADDDVAVPPEFPADLDATSSDSIQSLIEASLGSSDREPSAYYRKSETVTDLLDRIADTTAPASYVAHLNALIEISPAALSFAELVQALNRRLAKWNFHAEVRAWKDSLEGLLAEARFGAFVSGEYLSLHTVRDTCDDLGLRQAALLRALAKAAPSHLTNLSAAALFALTGRLADQISASEARELLRWALTRYRRVSERDDLASTSLPKQRRSTAITELEAYLMWGLFGHPDMRVRWRAVHASRLMVTLGQEELPRALTEWYSARTHDSALAGTYFYWLAAQTWYLVLLDLLTESSEHVLVSLGSKLESMILDRESNPLITRLAKRIHSKIPDAPTLSSAATDRHSPAVVQRDQDSIAPRDWYTGSRFKFDTMDTIPYWFEPLARVFGVHTAEVVDLAERWICDRCSIEGDVDADDPVRKWMVGDADWRLRSHRHGSVPTVEDLRTHLEFNAMLSAAGELAQSHSAVLEHDGYDSWEEWISRWDLASPARLLADSRQRTPLEPEYWISPSDRGVSWSENPVDSDCDRALGLRDALHHGFIVVSGHSRKSEYRTSESIYVSSALVSPTSAPAILHALDRCAMSQDYRIPPEGDELEFDETVAGVDFKLTGWVLDRFDDSERLDATDPFRNSLGGSVKEPGSAFRSFAALSPRHAGREWIDQRSGHLVAIFERWDDLMPGPHESCFQSEGRRLWVRWPDLCDFLKATEQCLIVECDISRYAPRPNDEKERDYVTNTRLYLIYPDGRVETPRGDHRPRTADSRGVGTSGRS